MTDFSSLGLSAPIMSALERLGYTQPTPIQQQAIPEVLKGRDLMGIAQTGTGKTAAFALPTLDYIIREERDPPKRGARVLVLAPTRELASQIAVSFRDYGISMPYLTVTCIFGGVKIERQIKKVVGGNDILVATPGRLIDLIDRKDLRLSDVEVLILDEADQMMDMGFIHALRKIVPLLPKDRQTLFFSATMSPQIKKLSQQFLTDPVRIAVAPANTTAERVTQSVIFVDTKEKQSLLGVTLLDPEVERALVFTRTKHGADRVVKRLAASGIEALAIHGNKSQSQRQRALAAFREGTIRVLIATDVAARGIDIEGITHVINFEIPNVPEQYVHRIGRTARAAAAGRAISFVANDERAYLKDIQKLLKVTLPVDPIPENFLKKANELSQRPALPKPDNAPNQNRAPKRPKRKKRPPTAEELLKADEAPAKDGGKRNRPNTEKSKADGQKKDRQGNDGPKKDGTPTRWAKPHSGGQTKRADGAQNKNSRGRKRKPRPKNNAQSPR